MSDYQDRLARSLGLAGGAEVEAIRQEWLAQVEQGATELFRAAGLSWWRGRSGQAVARLLFRHPLSRRPTVPLVLLHPSGLPPP